MSFYTLPDEILLIIFNYCDMKNLIQLSGVCKRFYHITLEPLNKKSNHLLVTGQMSTKFRERCLSLLSSYKLKFSTYYNWKNGKYIKRTLLRENISRTRGSYHIGSGLLQMTKDTLWLHNGNCYFYAFDRTKCDSVSLHKNLIFGKYISHIFSIVPYNDVIVTNHGDGSIRQWTIESSYGKKYVDWKVLRKSVQDNCIPYVMDVTSRNIITGSRDGEIKIMEYIREKNTIAGENIISKSNPNFSKLQSIAFDPTETKFAVGYDSSRFTSYIIYDMNKCYRETYKEIDTPSFKQLLWEDPNTILLQADYIINKVDVRSNEIVCTWKSPSGLCRSGDSSIYEKFTCISSDNQYAIMTGRYNSQVILWDQRQSAFIRVYDIPYFNPNWHLDWHSIIGIHINKIQSLQFDSSYMYVLANVQLYEFDFTHTE